MSKEDRSGSYPLARKVSQVLRPDQGSRAIIIELFWRGNRSICQEHLGHFPITSPVKNVNKDVCFNKDWKFPMVGPIVRRLLAVYVREAPSYHLQTCT
uniref:Transposase n=1 Tax=Steinernema glaseri TaxID=37863 RepID=A0A1I7ZRV8_9BILA